MTVYEHQNYHLELDYDLHLDYHLHYLEICLTLIRFNKEQQQSERNQLAAEFQEKVKEFNFLKQRLDATVNQRKQLFLEGARPEVDVAVKELLEENDLDLILPSEAVVYVKPEMNLTTQLLEKLNQ